MNAHQLRTLADREEIDYLFLKSALTDLAYPRDKISHLLQTKALIRVKKGLYVFGAEVAREPYNKEVLANLIYGPSAISLEYALSYYGMIPERVETITSITNKRNKQFLTPVGIFNYRYMHTTKYAIGITLKPLDDKHTMLIASPEKALADILYFLPAKISALKIKDYLFSDLRLEEESFYTLNFADMQIIAQAYCQSNVDILMEALLK